MPSPLVVLPQISGLEATLQTQFGSRIGLGKWVRYSLADIKLGTGTVGALLTADNASGQLAYTIIGDTMLVLINTEAGVSLSAAASLLTFGLPDDWRYCPRNDLGKPSQRAAMPCLTNDVVGASTGIVAIGAAFTTFPGFGDRTIFIRRDPALGNFGVGTISIWAGLPFECQKIGER